MRSDVHAQGDGQTALCRFLSFRLTPTAGIGPVEIREGYQIGVTTGGLLFFFVEGNSAWISVSHDLEFPFIAPP